MKLKRIEIDGFGKLVNKIFEFGPGLNLIYGHNEAGKSTLQRSILAALYGFLDDGSITAAKKATMTSYTPWNKSAPFGVNLNFEIDGGTQYRVERTFAPKAETLLYEQKSKKNINSKFSSASQGRLFFAEELLGMPRDVFENTSMVRQAELAALEKSASAVTDTLLRLSASASQESTASQSLVILETTLKEKIGTSRSRNKPLPEAERQLEDIKYTRTEVQTEYQSLVNQLQERDQAKDKLEKLQRERDKVEYQRLSAQRQFAQQQRQRIEQGDANVERCKAEVSRFQTWSTFPADAQPKIQRLIDQHEKIQSDAKQAEKIARRSKKPFLLLCNQIESLHKILKVPKVSNDIPDFENKPALETNSALQEWVNNEFSRLGSLIEEQKKVLALKTKNLEELSKIGHEGIAKDRQEFGKIETDLTQAKQIINQVQQTANQAGVPDDQWETIISAAQIIVDKWQDWSNFPTQLRDELLQLKAQYTPLHNNLAKDSGNISEVENKRAELKTKSDFLQKQVFDLENVRGIPQQEKSRIQELASQLENAKQSVIDSQKQLAETDQIYQSEQQAFDLQKTAIEPLEKLGIVGLNQLQQRWLNATQQLASAKNRFEQSQETWNNVGMPVAEFERLENTVKEIQSGVRSTPKPRRGCRPFFMSNQTGVIDPTPSEITIYSQIQPIYAEFTRQHDEIVNAESAIIQVESELRQNLGHIVPDTIEENTFALLLQLAQSHQQESIQIEKHKGIRDTHLIHFQRAENLAQQIQALLEKELQNFGINIQNIEDALDEFIKACAQKEKLIALETDLERVQSQESIVKQQWDQHQTQQQSLDQIEEKIVTLLGKAGIQVESASLEEGIQRFENGLENNRKWQEAHLILGQTQKQITEFEEKLTKARLVIATKEEKMLSFRQQMIKKYSGLLQNDFIDHHLGQLDASLHSFYSDQSELDKAQGQLDQLQLHAQNIQRDLNDWVEKEGGVNSSENEILSAIQMAGIEANQSSLDDALIGFNEAINGLANWNKAQSDYKAALQTQQAVRNNLTEFEAETTVLEVKLTELTTQHPEWKNLTSSDKPEIYGQNLQKLTDQVSQARENLLHLQDAIDRGAKSLRSLAELDEETVLVSENLEQLRSFSQALELAINELKITTHEFQKVFAPRLEHIVDTGLEQITNGRYCQVEIDPNSLNVRVLAPEQNELIETTQLSTGTRDLVYLILRMGITQLMSSSGEKLPLLLDDPFVEFDKIRQKAALEYLKNLSDQTQVLFFSKDDDIKNWFNGPSLSKSHYKVIELK